jgi:hypothetical protein
VFEDWKQMFGAEVNLLALVFTRKTEYQRPGSSVYETEQLFGAMLRGSIATTFDLLDFVWIHSPIVFLHERTPFCRCNPVIWFNPNRAVVTGAELFQISIEINRARLNLVPALREFVNGWKIVDPSVPILCYSP